MAGDDHTLRPPEDRPGDVDIWTLAGGIWARRRLVLTTAIVVLAVAGAVVMSLTPRYVSQAKIIIEDRESRFTRPVQDSEDTFLSDQAAVLSQVEVLSSRDLAGKVVDKLGLADNPDFVLSPEGKSFIGRVATRIGLASPEPAEVTAERAVERYVKELTVFQIGTSRVIAVEYSSPDADLAARIANALAEEYISVQRVTNYDANQDAIAWLSREIEQLRGKVADAEAKVAKFRSESGIFKTERDTSLGEQQLSELNAELIRASAAQSEAQTKARLINDLLKEEGSVEEAADVLSSPLIQRLREQQASVSRSHAELSATLLPGHPRMRELTAELGDLDQRIAAEARKIARGLENELALAGARVEAIKKSLTDLKVDAGASSQAQVQLRALEREATAQREILESFLRRYREATARQDVDVQPANARIISQASVASRPSYPPQGPILALAGVAGVLLGLMAAIVAEMAVRGRQAAPRGTTTAGPRLPEPQAEAERRAAPQLAVSTRGPQPVGATPVGKRLARLARERGMTRLAVVEMGAGGGGLSVARRLATAVEAFGVSAVIIDSGGSAKDRGEGAGLYDVLAGDAALGDVLRALGSGASQMIPAGRVPEAPETLIASGRFALVAEALLRRFDLVIVAAGGLGAGGLATAFARGCDLALLTSASGEAGGKTVRDALSALKAAGIGQAAIFSDSGNELALYDAVSVKGLMSDAA